MTTAMASDSLLLSTLPLDVIRMIVRNKGVSLSTVDQISQSWTSIVQECRNKLPVLELLSISSDCKFESGKKTMQFHIGLTVRSCDADYLKEFLRSKLQSWEECETTTEGMFSIKISTPITDNQQWDDTFSHFISLIISRFGRVSNILVLVATARFLGIIDKGLNSDLKLDMLGIVSGHFGIALRSFALDVLKRQKANHFTIYTHHCDEKIGDFLQQISKHTSTIYLKQLESPKKELGIFGKPQFYWQILARMLIENGVMRVRFAKGPNFIADESQNWPINWRT